MGPYHYPTGCSAGAGVPTQPIFPFPRAETVEVFGFPISGGVKLPYFTLNSVSCGSEEKYFRLNEGNYIALSLKI